MLPYFAANDNRSIKLQPLSADFFVCQKQLMEKTLASLFYRDSCPPAEMLGDYCFNELAPGERLTVAQHLRVCPFCPQELNAYRLDEEEAPSILDRIQTCVHQVLWATPLTALQPVRAEHGESRSAFGYEIDSTRIVLDMTPAPTGFQRRNILGKVEPIDSLNSVQAWNRATAELVLTTQLDQGYFEVPNLRPGEYLFCGQSGDSEIWFGPININIGTEST